MGCDGGSIPRRDEMVKLKKKAQKVSEKDRCNLNDCWCDVLCCRLKKI